MHRSHASAGSQSTATPPYCCAQTTPVCNSTLSSSHRNDVEVVLAVKEERTGTDWRSLVRTKLDQLQFLLADLLVFGPSLKLIVVTKETVAVHAIAEHWVALQLPQILISLLS